MGLDLGTSRVRHGPRLSNVFYAASHPFNLESLRRRFRLHPYNEVEAGEWRSKKQLEIEKLLSGDAYQIEQEK